MPELRSADGRNSNGRDMPKFWAVDDRNCDGSEKTMPADEGNCGGSGAGNITMYRARMEAERYLAAHGIADAAVDAWYLLEYVTGVSRARYLADRDKCLSREQWDAYAALIEKRGAHIPLQHLTGEQEFMGLPFLVNEDVLIPRQDTELLVETALTILKTEISAKMVQKAETPTEMAPKAENQIEMAPEAENQTEIALKAEILAGAAPKMGIPAESSRRFPYCVLDLCTGSGCIAISIAKLFKQWWSRTRDGKMPLEIYASDISEAALAVSRDNAGRLGANVHFIQSDLFDGIARGFGFDMIVSNPPYICTEVIEELDEEVRQHEPHLALDGGEDGLVLYRRIIRDGVNWLKPGGWLLFEIGYDQGEMVSEIMRQQGFSGVRVTKDLAGLDRVVSGRLRAEETKGNDCPMEAM